MATKIVVKMVALLTPFTHIMYYRIHSYLGAVYYSQATFWQVLGRREEDPRENPNGHVTFET